MVCPRKVSCETRSRERTSLSKDLNKNQASPNSPAVLGLQGSLEVGRLPRRGEGYQLSSAGCDATPRQRVAAPSPCPTSISSDRSRVFLLDGLPLAQPASSAFSSSTGKWVKQHLALQGTQPTNEVSKVASCVRDQTPPDTQAGALLELLGSAASFI